MPTALGDAFVDVHADTRNFQRDLKQGVTKSTQGATREMGSLGRETRNVGLVARTFIAGAAAGAMVGLTRGIQAAITASSNLEESQNAVTVAFGENAEAIDELGTTAADRLGLSQREFNELTVASSAFTESIAEGLGTDVPGVVDDLTTRVADFASVMNLEVGEAFDKFRAGLAGETEPLRNFGIDVSAARVEQVALAEGIIETGEAMTEADKITARYLTIMEQTEDTAGDFANTSDDLANSLRIANARIEDAQAALGQRLVPIAADAVSIFSNLVEIGDNWARSLEEQTEATRENEGMLGVLEDAVFRSQRPFEFGADLTDHWAESQAIAAVTTSEHRDAVLLARQEVSQFADGLFLSSEAAYEARDAAMELRPEVDNVAGAQANMWKEVDRANQELREQFDTIAAQLDPLFRLEQASDEAAAAQQAITDAVDEYGERSPEHIQAIEDAAQANADLRAAEFEVRDAVNLTRDAFIEQQIEMGLTREEAELLADEFSTLNNFEFKAKRIFIDAVARGDAWRHVGVGRQHGGPVTTGQTYMVGERGPELFVPNMSGRIIPNNEVNNIGGGSVEIINNFHGVTSDVQARRLAAAAAEGAIEVLSRKRVVQ